MKSFLSQDAQGPTSYLKKYPKNLNWPESSTHRVLRPPGPDTSNLLPLLPLANLINLVESEKVVRMRLLIFHSPEPHLS